MIQSQIYNPADTICAISTPPGKGAIAVVRLAGKDAFEIADKIWKGKKLSDQKSHTAHLGYIIDPADKSIVDQAVATIFRAPASFCGDDTIELAIHGSTWIQQQTINTLIAAGARAALPGEFTQRAFAAGKIDLAEAEAVADIIDTKSRADHKIAIDQLRGKFSAEINALREQLLKIASLLELELDFSEEDVEFASRDQIRRMTNDLRDRLSKLAGTFAAGNAIKNGIPVAIIGPTNAGKSSLLNAILNDDKAIVSNIHGTTRDIVEDTINIGPYLIRFKDTAGIRKTDDTIEKLGIERSLAAARSAQIIILVFDPEQPDKYSISDIDPAKTIIAINKSDIHPTFTLPSEFSEMETIRISAKNNHGIDALADAIKHKINSNISADTQSQIIITNARHAAELAAAAAAADDVINAIDSNIPSDLTAQHLRQIIYHLAAITGNISSPDILNNIFANFCIGK